MPDLLLELFSEEIPARMQAKAADDLRRMVTDKLVAEGLVYEGAKAFATPRRLALTVHGVPVRQPDLKDERKGPKVGAPDTAVQGFLKATGLKSLDDAKIQRDPKKGDFYVALIEKPGRPAIEVLAEILPVIVRTFPWPKQMRWGERSAKPGALTWVRPLHSIVATFGMETEEPDVVAFDVAGIKAGQVTRGHRFMAPDEFSVRRFEDYQAKLHEAKVVLDPQRRKDIILADAKELAFAQGFELVEDQVLLDEVAGLVEWPVVLMGSFDESFLSIPGEVIRATIRNNQKCFVVRQVSPPSASPSPHVSGGEGSRVGGSLAAHTNSPHPRPLPAAGGGREDRLANRFILVANIEASDGGKAIVAGNERVIRARLSDAKFFYETDLKNWKEKSIDERLKKFEQIVFHEKLGTQAERIARIERLAAEIAPLVVPTAHGAEKEKLVEKAKRAARLCKADLLTEVVGEFPELQGLMGKYYALAQGEDASVAAACEEHYKPQGPNDRVPSDPVSIAVALADKIDTLVGFWAIDEKPSGRGDQYGLRRAALGAIRIILENSLRIRIESILPVATLAYLIWGFRPDHDYPHGGYMEIVGERVDDTGKVHVTGGPWHELPYKAYLNFDGFVDEFGGLAGAAELAVAADDEEEQAYSAYRELKTRVEGMEAIPNVFALESEDLWLEGLTKFYSSRNYDFRLWNGAATFIATTLIPFFADRLKVQLREQGARHDLVDAVFALSSTSPLRGEVAARSAAGGGDANKDHPTPSLRGDPPPQGEGGKEPQRVLQGEGGMQDDLLMIVRRVEALGKFLDTDDGRNLLAGTKRASNILAIEEKRDKRSFDGAPDAPLYKLDEEKALAKAIDEVKREASAAVAKEDFAAAMAAMAKLRPAVDAFFDKVKVNDDDPTIRENRLKLLNEIRAATRTVADFSKIQD